MFYAAANWKMAKRSVRRISGRSDKLTMKFSRDRSDVVKVTSRQGFIVSLTLWATLAVLPPLLVYDANAAERVKAVRIGALTESWGPTPGIVGLRDGLTELGYRENEDFVIGVRFTQGNIAALPEAARELVQQGVDILFTTTERERTPLDLSASTGPTGKIYSSYGVIGLRTTFLLVAMDARLRWRSAQKNGKENRRALS